MRASIPELKKKKKKKRASEVRLITHTASKPQESLCPPEAPSPSSPSRGQHGPAGGQAAPDAARPRFPGKGKSNFVFSTLNFTQMFLFTKVGKCILGGNVI